MLLSLLLICRVYVCYLLLSMIMHMHVCTCNKEMMREVVLTRHSKVRSDYKLYLKCHQVTKMLPINVLNSRLYSICN